MSGKWTSPPKRSKGEESSSDPATTVFSDLPGDIVTYLSYFLPLRLQLMISVFFSSFSASIWKARMRLKAPWGWTKDIEDLEAALPVLFRQPHFVANIRKLSFRDYTIDAGVFIPVRISLDCAIRLTTVQLTIHGPGDSLFTNLLLSPAPLEYAKWTIGLHSNSCVAANHQLLTYPLRCRHLSLQSGFISNRNFIPVRKNDKLKYLKLTEIYTGRWETAWVLESIAASFPNLQTLYVPARDWKPLKVLQKLTHLYINAPEDTIRTVFSTRNYSAEQHVKLLVEMNPPLVGPYLLLEDFGIYRTILEYVLSDITDKSDGVERYASDIISLSNYKLDFTHTELAGVIDQEPITILQMQTFWKAALYTFLIRKHNFPFVVQTKKKMTSTIAFVLHGAIIGGRDDVFKRTVELIKESLGRALAQGLSLNVLFTARQHKHVMFTLISYLNKAKLDALAFVPELFDTIPKLRDPYGYSLLFYDNEIVEELHQMGMDWHNVGPGGLNAFESAVALKSTGVVKQILRLMSDADFIKYYTPRVCAVLQSFAFMDRMDSCSFTCERQLECAVAALHTSIIDGRDTLQEYPTLSEYSALLWAKAWATPINWASVDTIRVSLNDKRRKMTNSDLAFGFDNNADYANDVVSILLDKLGYRRAMQWVSAGLDSRLRGAATH